jgi:uncharacterized membrane protein YkoI
MSSLTGNKKLVIPVLLLVAFSAIASLAILLPMGAFAQTTNGQEDNNSTITTPEENNTTTTVPDENNTTTATNGLENNNTTQATEQGSEQGPEQIVGTIRVNENATADEFSEASLNVTVANATNIAKDQAANGTVIDAHLAVIHNYLVYNVVVADVQNSNITTVIVDAGDGSVLFVSQPIPVEKSIISDAIDEMGGTEEEEGG